jgi:hypothetical protein
MKEIRTRAFVGIVGLLAAGLLATSFSTAGCGSDDNGTGAAGSTGSAGSTGNAGSTGSGGTTGNAGSTGSGGNSSATNCIGGLTTAPPMALITDFSDTAAGTGNVAFTYGGGMATRVQGGASTYQNPASTAGTLAVTGGALNFMATVSAAGTGADLYPYNGFVLFINGPHCTNASTYTGVSFKISGNVGTCGLVFSFGDSAHTTVGSDAMRGTGPDGAYPPQYSIPASMVTTTPTTIMIAFNDPALSGGEPPVTTSPIDKTKITGVQWQFSQSNTATAPCTGSITIDDVTFY